MKILIIAAKPRSLLNFRGQLIKRMLAEGHQVIAMADKSDAETANALEQLGVKYVAYDVQRSGLSPLADLQCFRDLRKSIKHQQPELILAYTIKPIIWGGLAARTVSGSRFFAMVTGLGYAFEAKTTRRKVLLKLVKGLYRSALKQAEKVIFQNGDNLKYFVEAGLIPLSKAEQVYGSGVDLEYFQRREIPANPPAVFLCIARLLVDKGLREYVAAARIIKKDYPNTRFLLAGAFDPSPNAIKADEVEYWCDEGVIEYQGEVSDVRNLLAQCHIYTLPSYHEGMPRTVLEALAIGRPILTTDVPGCRQTVDSEVNGLLVAKANVEELALAMEWFIKHPDIWPTMADHSHSKAREFFDVHKVNESLFDIMKLS